MLDPNFVLSLIALGAIVGVLAGLLGIGGGTVLVPVLTTLFLSRGVPVDRVVHLALGTSLATIIFTSVVSMHSHHRRDGVDWHIVRWFSPGIAIGSVAATLILSVTHTLILTLIFTLFIAYVGVTMFRNKPPKEGKSLPSNNRLVAVGSGIGCLSTIVSIGGGSLSVPYLVAHNTPMKRAIGTSAALGFPIALLGACGYWILGEFIHSPPALEHSLGYIYWPAVLVIAVASMCLAPVGVMLTYRVPVNMLKKVFALLLLGLSLRMLLTVISQV